MPADQTVRDAATVVVLRDAPDGQAEVLLLRRHGRSGFAANAWVFPGGVVDEPDGALAERFWSGIDPPALAGRFDATAERVLAYHVAAVRETFEEAGVLFARSRDGAPPDLDDPDLLQLRRDLADRTKAVDFAAWLEQRDLVLDLADLTYLAWWMTPKAEPRRYDARFFAARLPQGQTAGHDRLEITDQRWIKPAAALEELAAGRLPMIFPTIKTLEDLARFTTAEEVLEHARSLPAIRRLLPHAVLDDEGRLVRILHPDDPEYPAELYADAV